MLVSPGERGQGLVEYAFILLLVAIIVVGAVAYFGTGVGGMFSNIVNGV